MKNHISRAAFLRSIQWRLIVILVLITFVLMSVVWVFLNIKVESVFYSDFKSSIETSYNALKLDPQTTAYETLKDSLETDPVIMGVIRSVDKSFTIIDQNTTEIKYSSDPLYKEDPQRFRNEIFKSENLLSVLSNSTGKITGENQAYTRASTGDFYDYVRSQSLKDGKYIIFFKYARSKAIDVLDKFNNIIFWGMVFSVLAALFIGFILSRTITRPIYDIMHKAEKITDGEFGYALEVKSDDELGKLAKTFNFMSSRLKAMLTEISSEKKKVETILNYMTDGIIAFNRNGQVIHTNPASKMILESSSAELTPFDAFMENLGIELTISKVNEEQVINETLHKVQYKDRFLRVQLASFTDENNQIDGIIAVLQDITEEHKLENMRREFVANVSHELRTPLTSVKSYTETLLDGALQDQMTAEHFLGVINDETDRMTRLVKDLLTLSQHDGGIKLNVEDISISELTQSCVERMKREAQAKKQELKIISKQNIPLIRGDRHRIDQLLINIIGNAIKYTPERGRINVQLYSERDYAVVIVEDNGIGIPEQDLGRIFERFYRVDKARSRQMGGTGLGLAIAKEIAVMHGGNISAKSKLGKGTQIVIELPLKKRQQQAL
ncbi:MAG: cell wall metabolism sensor histidine kinase WalK [Clostridia bacterium]|nr:cell wall metabolism sensor histidine kinase WalK [Clostridia bacterium]